MKLWLLIIIGPWLLSRVIKHWVDLRYLSEPKRHEESSLEQRLNNLEADKRFESTWNLVGTEERHSREAPRWRTPEEMLLEEQLKRSHEIWTPSIPGIVHESAGDHR